MYTSTFRTAWSQRTAAACRPCSLTAYTSGLAACSVLRTRSAQRCIRLYSMRGTISTPAESWASRVVCRSAPDPGEPDRSEASDSEGAPVLNMATDPSGTKVALIGFILLASVFILPRLAVLSIVGVERALVGTLLSFEQVAAAAIWTLLRWAGYLLAALLAMSVLALAVLGTNDHWLDDMFAWSRSITNLVTDEEEKASLQAYFGEKERTIRKQKQELDRLSGKKAEDGK